MTGWVAVASPSSPSSSRPGVQAREREALGRAPRPARARAAARGRGHRRGSVRPRRRRRPDSRSGDLGALRHLDARAVARRLQGRRSRPGPDPPRAAPRPRGRARVDHPRCGFGPAAGDRHRAAARPGHRVVPGLLAPDLGRVVDRVDGVAPAPLRRRLAASGVRPAAGRPGAGGSGRGPVCARGRTARRSRSPCGATGSSGAHPASSVARSEDRADFLLERRDVPDEDVARVVRLAGGDREQNIPMLVDAREQVRQPVDHQVPDPQ